MNRNLLLLALPLIAACSQADTPAAPVQTLHSVMLAEIDGPADALWEVTNAVIGDEGGLDPSKMDDARWLKIAELADKVAAGASKIALMDPITAAPAGTNIGDSNVPGGHSAAQVQAAIDRDPAGLRALAETLGTHMTDIAAAARAHDAATAGPLVDQLDGVCESCHLQYWYPEQAEAVKQFQDSGVVDPNHPGLGPVTPSK
jgi:hypothetical protein